MANRAERRPSGLVIVRSLIYFFTFYIVTALYLVLGSWLLLGPRSWAMKGLELHGRTCVWLLRLICGTKLDVRGQENLPKSGCLVVAKHQSAWDSFGLISLFRDPAIVLKDELKWIPFYGWFCVKFEHILVKREKASAALKALIRDAKQRVSIGREVVIFPEGTRTIPGAPPDYKPGYIALYEALNVVTVPLALNSGLFWPRRSIWRYPGTIVVEFLPSLPPGLPRTEFRRRIETEIEAASRRLIEEAAQGDEPPPLARQAESKGSI
ncbi:lysophospholipid acyltransferase family protein [Hyphomicrobium sp.]|jgi:1-acyl-sn-glycerol-3-phosphate acyltransferase|uniref:lysophospholipid acyltransferase family protein n=1 Tax=Hyphomicrobium sp. TaxID=82 RepID=UPI002B60658A|nr:lysophospholipid acyltransferase family protein [Hyphomicrobium sp.]HVZ06082.1 lysophospholipid acyltransferase family protein [Hyphomicrobium sp.]